MSYRFYGFDIDEVTVENYAEVLPKSLARQIEIFLPPDGSFATPELKRYLEILKNYEEEDEGSSMTLANRLRIAFRDLEPDTICGKFPKAELPLKRRLRCVAEYLIRSSEFKKLKDENGKLIKRKGVLGKMVVIYQPQTKLLDSLRRQGLIQ
jgi:ribosomal protein L36